VELNGASQEDLEQIPGIGPFYAKNILKYRDRLGGFMSKEQLLEVWKMDATKYEEIESFVEVNKTLIRKININEATAEEFKQHPYLNWNIANSLVKIRNKKIRFNAVEEIKESVLMDEEQYDRIKHYLTL
jgi:DNA uptake protein ComE-like DNA-binding protein